MYLQTVRGQCGLQVHAYDTDWPYSPTPMPVGSFRPRSWLKTKIKLNTLLVRNLTEWSRRLDFRLQDINIEICNCH